MAFVRSSVIIMVIFALNLNLCPLLFYVLQHDECSALWFRFDLLPRCSPPHVSCIPMNHMVFSFHAMVCHCLVSTSPYALGGNVDPSRVVFLRFRKTYGFFFSFALFSVLGVLVFPRITLLHLSPSYLLVGNSSYCYRDEVAPCRPIGFTLRAPVVPRWRSRAGPPAHLSVRFGLLSPCLVVRAPNSIPLSGCVSSFVADGSTPLDQFSFPFFAAYLPERSNGVGLRSDLAANRSCSSRLVFFVLFFGIPAPRVQRR